LGLIRIVFFIGLLYILYRLVTSPRKISKTDQPDIGRPNLPPQDILVEDPICHTYIPKQQAFVLEQGEKILYFCSKACRDTFIAKQGAER